ncbi:DUF421 domain-containing protein [Evansella sp. LMS18]|uniref:DUF421 domain-containing protein n=1 Tax=Evansella sp. LMS18 TaxID=2924033 RepID=UPI0020D10EEF|nr:YetF domain-containing protein [Evansella sp. LMS18]UTR11504.1 DUF421 domain-containing protein [Evansella sp. LMS18]
MPLRFVLESVVLVLSGFILLRVAGRKSISQLTIPSTVVLISIGAIIVQPIIETSVLKTIITVAVFVTVLFMIEKLQMKFKAMEKFIIGSPLKVIEDGQIIEDNLRKVRLTTDIMEMYLRQQGILGLHKVKNGWIEANGRLGYELFEDDRFLTVGEFKKLMDGYFQGEGAEAGTRAGADYSGKDSKNSGQESKSREDFMVDQRKDQNSSS